MKKNIFFTFLIFFLLSSQEIDLQNINQSVNLTQEQLELLQNTENQTFEEIEEDDQDLEESLKEKEKFIPVSADIKFGYSYFSKIPTTITPTQDLPVPGDYRISLNDTLSVLLTGSKDARYSLKVNLDGTIQIPEIGSINVVSLTLNQVDKLLSNLISESFVGVNIDVTLTNLSAKKVTIVGAVEVPGTYLVNPFTTVSSVLAYSGGLSEYASLREIVVIKPNGDRYLFDLYDLLIFGDRSDDVTIDAGDTVLVQGTSNFVKIDGAVIRPGIYEFSDSETIDDLISYALGLKGNANSTKIAASRINPENLTLETEEIKLNKGISPKGIITLTAFGSDFNTKLDILVQGPLQNSGYFPYEKYNLLEDLIKDLKFTDNLYPFSAVIEQFDSENLISKQFIFNLNDKTTYENIKLNPNDKIAFLSRQNFADGVKVLGFSDKVDELFSSYIVSMDIAGNKLRVPVYGDYRISDFINYFGLNLDDLSDKRLLIENLNSLKKSVAINDVIKAEKSQSIRIFEERKFNISGPAVISGDFKLENEILLSDIIKNLSFDEDIFPFLGVVEKFSPETLEVESILFSLDDVSTQNILIDNYSKLFFLSRSTYRNIDQLGLGQRSLSLISDYDLAIRYRDNSIKFPVFGKFSVVDIVDYLGFDLDDIEKGQTTYIQPLENFTIVDDYSNMNLTSSKFHKLSFRFRNSDLISVTVRGEVNLPGTYTLETSATLSDLYSLMGGFKDNAAQNAIILTRESVREIQLNALEDARRSLREFLAINSQQGNESLNTGLISFIEQNIEPKNLGRIGGDFSADNKLIKDFVLSDGDSIFVPQTLNTVSVIGEVLNPNTILHRKGYSHNQYVNNAGGYKQFAFKNGVYVVKANGTIKKIGRNVFLSNYKIEPGDVIVVPRDMSVYNQFIPTFTSVSTIISNLAFGAASLNALENN